MIITNDAYKRFLDFFELTQKERLDGLDASYFSDMTETEKKEAFEHLKVNSELSEENLRGLYLCSHTKAIDFFKACLETPLVKQASKREGEAFMMGRVIMAGYICNYKPTKKNINLLANFNIEELDKYTRNTLYNLIPSQPTTPKIINLLRKAVSFESESLGFGSSIKKLMSIYGFKFSTKDEQYKKIYNLLRNRNPKDQETGFKEMEKLSNPIYVEDS